MGLAARQVGCVAMQFYGKVSNLEKDVPGNFETDLQRATAQALSDVDLVAQEIILMALHERWGFVAVDAEEKTPSLKLFARNRSRYSVIIDPIDGTLNYLTQRQQFGVVIGLLRDDRYEACLAHFPQTDRLYKAVRDRGCTLTVGGRTRAVRAGRTPELILHESGASEELLERFRGAGFELLRGGCSTMDSTIGATRLGAASVFQRQPSVRRCVGALISREAGAYLCDQHGKPYDCVHPRDTDSLIIARDRRTADRVLKLLA
jgi:fructose-1,6-bisphosphatase/inositol monophosphatase family enzyme